MESLLVAIAEIYYLLGLFAFIVKSLEKENCYNEIMTILVIIFNGFIFGWVIGLFYLFKEIIKEKN